MAETAERIGLDSIWVGDHLLYRDRGPQPVGPWEAWTQLAALAAVTSRVADRSARGLHQLPQPGDAGSQGRRGRRDQRWAPDPGPRRGLERGRVPRLRVPVRPSGEPVRGGIHDHPRAPAPRRPRRPRRRASTRSATCHASRRRPAPGGPPLLVGSIGPADAGDHDAARRRVERVVRAVRQQRHRLPARCATASMRRAGRSGATPREVERTAGAARGAPRRGRASRGDRRRPQPRSDPRRRRNAVRRRSAPSPRPASATSSSCSTRSPSSRIAALAPTLAALDG